MVNGAIGRTNLLRKAENQEEEEDHYYLLLLIIILINIIILYANDMVVLTFSYKALASGCLPIK